MIVVDNDWVRNQGLGSKNHMDIVCQDKDHLGKKYLDMGMNQMYNHCLVPNNHWVSSQDQDSMVDLGKNGHDQKMNNKIDYNNPYLSKISENSKPISEAVNSLLGDLRSLCLPMN